MQWEKYKPETFEYNGKWIKNWFSNMVMDEIKMDGLIYPSVENYYQSRKSTDPEVWKRFTTLSPSKAKYEGKNLKDVREDWEKVKRTFMFYGLVAKFNKPEWKQKLLDTGEDKIIEWNNWGDKIWGVTVEDNEGNNMLGDILMNIRAAFQYERMNKQKENVQSDN